MASFENLFDDLLTFKSPSVNYNIKEDVDTEKNEGETNVSEGGNGDGVEDKAAESSSAGESSTSEGATKEPKAETKEIRDSSGADKEIEQSTGFEAPKESKIDFTFLDKADDLFPETNVEEVKETEKPVEDASPLFANVEEDSKKKKYTDEDFKADVSKPTSEVIEEALRNTVLGNALEGNAKSPRPGIGMLTTNPVNTNNITGNIEALEAMSRADYSKRLKENEDLLTEITSRLATVNEAKRIEDEAIAQVIKNTETNEPEYLESIKEQVKDYYPDANPEQLEEAYQKVLRGLAVQVLRNIPEFVQNENLIVDGIKEIDSKQNQLTKMQDDATSVLESIPTNRINNATFDEIKNKIQKAVGTTKGQETIDKLKRMYSEDVVFPQNALDNQRSAIAPADGNDVIKVLNKVADSLRIPVEQLDKSITPEQKVEAENEAKEAINSEGSKSYFQRILESGEEFNFDDWAKEAGWKGVLTKGAAAIAGGAVAGPIGYDFIKNTVEKIANDVLQKKSDKPRTDKQIRKYYSDSASELENWSLDDKTSIENATNNYVYQRDRFEEEFSKVREEYENFFESLPTNAEGAKVVDPKDLATAKKLNAKMAEYNAIADRYNGIGDKLVENGADRNVIVKAKGQAGHTDIEDNVIDYDKTIDEWANDLQPKAKSTVPDYMQGAFVRARRIDGNNNDDFKELDDVQKETLDNMLGQSDLDIATLPNGKEFSADIAMELLDVLSEEYHGGRVYFDYNAPRIDLSNALADKNPAVMEILKKAIDDAEGNYSPDFGTGRAAIIKTTYDDAASESGYFQANFVRNTVPQVDWLNYMDDIDLNATMGVDASPEAMATKYGEAWENADDYHKEVAQAIEKLVATENDPIGINIYKGQMTRILDNNDPYAKLIHDTYLPEYFESLDKQKDAVEQIETNWLLDYNASVLKRLEPQDIYRIAQLALERGPTTEDEIVSGSNNRGYQIDTQDIYEIEDDNSDELNAESESSESTSESATGQETEATQKELTEEELARIFGIAYNESAKPKSDYNYGLSDEEAYSDEDVKSFITVNRRDPIFRAFVDAVRNYK